MTLYPITKEELEEMHKVFNKGLKQWRKKIKNKKNGEPIQRTQSKDNGRTG